LPTKTN